ncbi:hypothetical protein FUA23_06550 [Neolewinella aurantiaca]|uniref:Integrase SAM-like N-terminal domain-containing protein n=2 Tax=Neolewinella aurantiaca TaxID=2602767 RepID=A0A5C7FVS4_9BACT|nr:hypothetical protein FUA23_06550 [Neolewinella aurantiaca]
MTSSTIINYARSLRDLMEYHHAEADAITARDILVFLAEREKSTGKSTLNTLCCALKYFYGKVLGDPDRILAKINGFQPGFLTYRPLVLPCEPWLCASFPTIRTGGFGSMPIGPDRGMAG